MKNSLVILIIYILYFVPIIDCFDIYSDNSLFIENNNSISFIKGSKLDNFKNKYIKDKFLMKTGSKYLKNKMNKKILLFVKIITNIFNKFQI